MDFRYSPLLVGIALLGCQMDNPAFGTGDDELGDGTTEAESGEAESADSVGESVGDGDGDGDSVGDGDGDSEVTDTDAESSSGTTDADCPQGTPCAPCHVCDPVGECVPDVGATCEGPTTHCSDFLYGAEGGTCYTLADQNLSGRCDDQGMCSPSPAADCPVDKGAPHIVCDDGCVNNPGACQQFAPAANVDLPAMCVVQGDGPECMPYCDNDNASAIKQYTCNYGQCESVGETPCEAYKCAELMCNEACELNEDCALGFSCLNYDCVG